MQVAFAALLLALPLALGACATISPSEQVLLMQQPDCANPQDQINALQRARRNEIDRTVTAVSSVTPTGLVVGTVQQDFGDRVRVVSGEWNRDIDAAIRRIRTTCGMLN